MHGIRVVIKGRVQGVWYRKSTKEKADELGVKGWVKNLPNGDVEACLAGEQNLVESMLEWCRQGPRLARVDEVLIQEETQETFSDFTIIR